jgi:hypothetical protein
MIPLGAVPTVPFWKIFYFCAIKINSLILIHMKRIIYLLLPVVALLMSVQSCCCDDENAPVAAPVIQPNGDYPVDLGLSVKWATCNVGATTPEELGDYYTWGDTATYYEPGYAHENPQAHWKEDQSAGYVWDTYRHCNGSSNTLTKYCNKNIYGDGDYFDNDTTLLPVDDVAHYKWGGSWRIPTLAEYNELLDSCDWEYITQNGVNGLKVTSRKDSSQSIFLPAAGFRNGTNRIGVGFLIHYWSSSLSIESPYNAWYLLLPDPDSRYMRISSRCDGHSVRPVCP